MSHPRILNTKATTAIINVMHNGKVQTFDPAEFAEYDPHGNIQEETKLAVTQYAQVGHWLAVMRKRHRGAETELATYTGRLYHQMKAEGAYLSKYRGTRPTEDGIKHALWDDKTFRDLNQNSSDLQEICDHLWVLQRTVERKMDALKEISGFIRAANYSARRVIDESEDES